ncbi:MAG: aspartyl/asparaginyl beta-hydroxylase domain-containing protein [Sphingomonadaceae bacterium]|uniref:aspartyl/asparaginyl beta-hydroxylase domain-containing protein n=1 Tax=Thermaurantiacus sp. TaxID=2820283 RepID=UPI00298F129B|nr:aspartyl/asparaginyl beta-hydroxylase domain-containing protein [Thermaurantiacus sp.]MCS6987379.1 aspartyl/asparaginyl beta-hydroxylase domain-containing protein [Sphingomonadaceae bacterium]MDW8415299.1 aspartyl/asparaginyl beta-hydroxylase domain-containing protein [Thermaurantiacus sp.]
MDVRAAPPLPAAAAQALRRAAELERTGQGAEAARQRAEAARLAPGHPAVENALGLAAQRAGDFAVAARHFQRAAQADPTARALWINLAAACRGAGDVAGEEAALERALALDQTDLLANVRLAELHERTGDLARATHRWSAVLQLAASLADTPPGLEPVLTHARAFVTARMEEFGRAVETALDPLRRDLAPQARRRFDACLDAVLGRRRIFPNVCSGVHFPFLPADEFFDRAHFPWLAELEAATPRIRAELEALLAEGAPGLEPYVAMAPGTPPNKWSALDHRLDWGAFFLWKLGERRSEACARCPETARVVESLPLADMPGRAPTVFFSLLEPGTRLPAHTGVSNVRAIVHLPLIVPEGCGLRVGGETRAWREGEALVFDDTIEHEAWNLGPSLRAVLILDTWNPHLTEIERDLLRAFFRAADASGHNPYGRTAVAE